MNSVMRYDRFKEEVELSHQAVLRALLTLLQDLGVGGRLMDYVRGMQGYPRTLYHMLLWVPEFDLRRELGVAIGMHAVGVKLLDDVMDADHPDIPVAEQLMGLPIIQHAEALLSRHADADALAGFAADHCQLWRTQLEERRHAPTTLSEWNAVAGIKSGLFLASYAALACRAAGRAAQVARARQFSEAFGMLYMMGDDWDDHIREGETTGNLAQLVRSGAVSSSAFAANLQSWRLRGVEAARDAEAICEIVPFLDHFAGKLLSLYSQLSP